MTSKPNKPAKKHYVPVDGTAVNTGWTIRNAKYTSKLARQGIALENRARVAKRIAENHGGKTTHIPAEF